MCMPDGFPLSFEVSLFRRHIVIRKTTPRLVVAPDRAFNSITIPRCVRFTMHRSHAMVPDENYIALVVAVLRRSCTFSYFPETAQCEPYVTRKRAGAAGNIVKFSWFFYLDRIETSLDKIQIT